MFKLVWSALDRVAEIKDKKGLTTPDHLSLASFEYGMGTQIRDMQMGQVEHQENIHYILRKRKG